jgi:hypothetical protein
MYDIIILIVSCIEYLFHYRVINSLYPNLTVKQKAYILSIKSSLTLFLIGVYYNVYYFTSKLKESAFYSSIDSYSGRFIIIYFTAYLLMDLYIGYREYKGELTLLTTWIHHIVYICINGISIYYGIYPIYLLNMLSELPTFLLGIGSFNSKFRNDTLFGICFFATRLFYHFILAYSFRHHSSFLYLSILTLGLHIYWFYNWWKKYGIKIIE